MIGVYYGNEPYLIKIEKNRFMKEIKNPEMNLICSSVMSEEIIGYLNTYPIMDERRLAVLDIDSLAQIDNADFRSYMENPSDSSDLFIMVRSLDMRTKFAKELANKKLLHECKKLTDINSVVKYLLPVIKKAGGRITEAAMKEFLTRENYLEADINLLNVINDLKGLLTIDKDITLPMVKTYIRINEVQNCYALAKMIVNQDFADLKKQSELISGSDSIGVLSLLMREYRIAWKLKVINGFQAKYAVFKNLSQDTLFQGIDICQKAIDSVKNGTMPSDEVLKITFMKLAKIISSHNMRSNEG